MSVEGAVETHAKMAVDEIQNILGEKWAALTEAQRESAARASKRIVQLEWRKRVNGVDVDEDLQFVRATVNQFKLAGEVALYDAFWEGVNKALEALGSFLVGAGKSLIPGVGSLVAGIDIGALINDA